MATGFLFYQVHQAEQRHLLTELQHDASIHARQIEGELRSCLLITKALQQFLCDPEARAHDRFTLFTRPLLTERPEVQALEWIPRIRHADRDQFEKQGLDNPGVSYRIMDRTAAGQMTNAPQREFYYPVHWVEPWQGNEQAAGFDLGSETTRLGALVRACEHAEVLATAPINLVQEKGGQRGCLFYAPVYRRNQPLGTAEQRWQALDGFALGVFRVGDLLQTALRPAPPEGLVLELWDSESGATAHYSPPTAAPAQTAPSLLYPACPRHDSSFFLVGRTWTLIAQGDGTYVAKRYSRLHWFLLPLGLTLTGLLVFFLNHQASRYYRFKSDIQHQEHQIAQQAALTPLGCIEWDTAFRVRTWSAGAGKIFGYTAGEALGQHAAFIIPPAAHQHVDQIWHQLLAQTGGTRSTNENITRDGRTIVCDWYNLTQTDKTGQVTGVLSLIEDITVRRRAAEMMRASETKYYTLFNAMADGVIALDDAGEIISANPAAARLLELPLNELLGRRLWNLSWTYVGEDGVEVPARTLFDPANFHGVPAQTTQLLGLQHAPDQPARWLLLRVLPSPGGTGPSYVMFADVTERRQAIWEVERQARRIQHLNETLQAVHAVNRLIRQEKDRQRLLTGVCEALVQTRGYLVAWVGQLEVGSMRVVPVAQAGAPDDFLQSLPITWDDSPAGRGPCGTALRERRPVVVHDIASDPNFAPWREAVASTGVVTLAAFPLLHEGALLGTLIIKADFPDAFQPEEMEVLTEMAYDIAHALQVIKDDSTHEATRHELQEREEEARLVLATAVDGFSVCDNNGRFLEVNAAYCRQTGYSREEFLGMSIHDLQPQVERETIAQRFTQIAASGSCRFEAQHQRKDGSVYEAELSVTHLPNGGGGGRYYAFIHDITMAKAAGRIQRRYQLMMQTARDVVLLVALDGRIMEANEAALAFYGYSREELLGMKIFALRRPETGGQVREQMERARREGVLFETEHRRRDGRWLPVEVSSRAVMVDGAEMLMSIIRDISERKQAQLELWKSEERFRALVEKAADVFLIIEPTGLITYVSPAIAHMTGRQPRELMGHHFGEHVRREELPAVGAVLAQILSEPERAARLEVHVQHKDGSWRVLAGVGTNFLTHPAIQGIVINCQDVTLRDTLERQVRRAQKMEAIGTLAGGIAHDFNNMLFAIMGFTTIVQRRVKDAKTLADLEQVMTASRRSAELVNQLLLFSREGEKTFVALSFTPLLKETSKLLRATLPANIEIRHDLCAHHDRIKADPVQLQQVIMNLATNALHAMRENGGVLTLSTEEVGQAPIPPDVKKADTWLCFMVRDTGCGITPEHLEHIFEPFFTTKPVGEGTGLGLPVVHGIVTAAGGFIEVESTLQQGTCFKVFFPLLPAQTPPVLAQERPKLLPPTSTGHILCVDDETLLTRMCQDLLEAEGYRVTPFNDSLAALEFVRQQAAAIDLIITDQTMPKMTGLQLAKAVRDLSPALPIILVTGYDHEQVSVAQCQQLKIVLQHKPLESNKLKEMVHHALQPQPSPS